MFPHHNSAVFAHWCGQRFYFRGLINSGPGHEGLVCEISVPTCLTCHLLRMDGLPTARAVAQCVPTTVKPAEGKVDLRYGWQANKNYEYEVTIEAQLPDRKPRCKGRASIA